MEGEGCALVRFISGCANWQATGFCQRGAMAEYLMYAARTGDLSISQPVVVIRKGEDDDGQPAISVQLPLNPPRVSEVTLCALRGFKKGLP
jgi:hypothetical protein